MGFVVIFLVGAVVLVGLLLRRVRVQQYEPGIVFRFGRLLAGARQPGSAAIVPFVDGLVTVSLRTVVLGIPARGGITGTT